MADDVKTTITVIPATEAKASSTAKPAAKPVAKKAAPKAVAKKTAAKPVAKKTAPKAAAKKTTATKPAVKKAAPKTVAKKPVAKAAPAKGRGGRRKAAPTLDAVTAAVWKKIGKANVKNFDAPVGIQVIVRDLGTFYIAVKNDGGKTLEVMQDNYNDRAGTFETSFDEIMKIAAGKYDFLGAIAKGSVYYYGDLKKGVAFAGLFK